MASAAPSKVASKAGSVAAKTSRTDYYAKHSITITHIGPKNAYKVMTETNTGKVGTKNDVKGK